jgi:hypothetical protein
MSFIFMFMFMFISIFMFMFMFIFMFMFLFMFMFMFLFIFTFIFHVHVHVDGLELVHVKVLNTFFMFFIGTKTTIYFTGIQLVHWPMLQGGFYRGRNMGSVPGVPLAAVPGVDAAAAALHHGEGEREHLLLRHLCLATSYTCSTPHPLPVWFGGDHINCN